ERVDWNAVSPQTWAWIERLEAEGLGLGGVDDLPDVDAHAIVEDLQLVDEGDVDGSIGVLQDLTRLGDFGAGDRDHARHPLAIKNRGQFQAGRVQAANDFGDRRRGVVRVARVLALGTEGQKEVLAGP